MEAQPDAPNGVGEMEEEEDDGPLTEQKLGETLGAHFSELHKTVLSHVRVATPAETSVPADTDRERSNNCTCVFAFSWALRSTTESGAPLPPTVPTPPWLP